MICISFSFRWCVFFYISGGKKVLKKIKYLEKSSTSGKNGKIIIIKIDKNYKIFNMFSEVNITNMTCYAMQGRISLGRGVNSVIFTVMFSINCGTDTSDSPVTGVDSIVLARWMIVTDFARDVSQNTTYNRSTWRPLIYIYRYILIKYKYFTYESICTDVIHKVDVYFLWYSNWTLCLCM